MTRSLENDLGQAIAAFVAKTLEEARVAFDVFRATGTLTASGCARFVERVPSERKYVWLSHPGPFDGAKAIQPTVVGFDGAVYFGDVRATGLSRYVKIFERHPQITTVSHVRSPYLGAWAQTHRALPIRYLPLQRFSPSREVPVYVDHRQAEEDFILERIAADSHTTAILEANGVATVWGNGGLRKTAEFILNLEEAARLQLLSEAIGGSREYGPGVLAQPFRMSSLSEAASLPASAN